MDKPRNHDPTDVYFPILRGWAILLDAEERTKHRLLVGFIVFCALAGLAFMVVGIGTTTPVQIVGGLMLLGFAAGLTLIPAIVRRRRAYEAATSAADFEQFARNRGHRD